jgi:hypothetical protein
MFDNRGSALVEEIREVRGLFSEKLELYDYPFDKQVTKMYSQHFSVGLIIAAVVVCKTVNGFIYITVDLRWYCGGI